MRKVINTSSLDWDDTELIEKLLGIRTLTRFIIIETVEEDD